MIARPTRRSFLQGCAAASVMAGVRPGTAIGGAGDADQVLIALFLRGGADALNLLPPISGQDRTLYEAARPTLRVPLSGSGAALPLDDRFGLHPAAGPLHSLFQDGRMAVVLATGMDDPTRSHFEAEDFMELGTPGSKTVGSGWLHRHLLTAPGLPSEILIPALAAGYYQPTSLLGSSEAVTLSDPAYFSYSWGPYMWQEAQKASMGRIYAGGTSAVHTAGQQTLIAAEIVAEYVTDDYQPSGGAVYPEDELGNHLKVVAQMLKIEVGIQVVTVDFGGWDTHESQGDGGGGFFAAQVASLASGLEALLTDLEASGWGDRFTVVTMTEFGRRLDQNADGGTDHGHGAAMMLLGNHVIGGVHGQWPGLHPDNLFEGIDLEMTTDYRRVLSEVLIRRQANANLGVIFPGYTGYEPLGVVQGEDLPPNYGVPGLRTPGGRVVPG